MNSDEEDSFYSSNSGGFASAENSEESPITLPEQFDDSVESPVSRRDKNYTILTDEDINQRQNDDISTVSTVLSISKGAACSQLRYHNWNVDNVYDHLFAEQNRVPDLIFNKKNQSSTTSSRSSTVFITCEICFDIKPKSSMISSNACGKHFCCSNCWIIYIHISINDSGSGCLNLSCPHPSCTAIVDLDTIDSIALSSEDKNKYYKYLHGSYVENSRQRKWCVGPGCDFVVQYEYFGGEENLYDVTCDCSNKFCWNCSEESHRPVDCKTVESWKSVTWILANTKACPMCKHAIEKNEGCNRMTCISPCFFEFCWACLGPFKDNHVCSTTKDDTTRITNDKKINRETLVHSEKSTPRSYYERWAYYDRLMKRGLDDLSRARTEHVQKLMRVYGLSNAETKFVTEAWDQIFECRRVLKWSYAYGYYMPENEKWKKNFFEYLLGEAESALERLRFCAEQEMVQFLDDKGGDGAPLKKSSNDFRSKLVCLTEVTKNFFQNLVRALEDGIPEVESFCFSKLEKKNKKLFTRNSKLEKKNEKLFTRNSKLAKKNKKLGQNVIV